jgi:hypothetical protein
MGFQDTELRSEWGRVAHFGPRIGPRCGHMCEPVCRAPLSTVVLTGTATGPVTLSGRGQLISTDRRSFSVRVGRTGPFSNCASL